MAGSNMVFLAAGMGGGTGTGAAPIIAAAAREMGILTVGVVTKPFHFESGRRMRVAEAGIAELHEAVDTLIIIPNQNLFRVANERTTFADAFGMADQVLCSGISCITDLMVKEGLVNLDFADVCSIMSEMGTAMIGAGEAAGERRAHRAAEAAIANPLFDDASLNGARGVLISITGGEDLTLYEVDEAASRIRQEVDEEANIIVGAIIEPALEQAMRVSVVATGIDQSANRLMHVQSFAKPVLPPNVSPASLDRTAGASVSTVESRSPVAAGTEFETPFLAPLIPFPEPTGRRQALDEGTHFDPPAIRWLLDRFAVAASERRQARRASA
jgi:cell division protein FtsZ